MKMQSNYSTNSAPTNNAGTMGWWTTNSQTPWVVSANEQPTGTCREYQPMLQTNTSSNPRGLSWYTPPALAYPAAPVQSTTSALHERCLAPADTTTMQLNERGELEEVVIKDGQVFRISFVDEPMPAEPSEVPYETETLPSIATELSLLMDNSKFLESAIPVNELDQTSSRDWINYDELPLLSQHVQSVSSSTNQLTQQFSAPASGCMSTAMRSQDSAYDENHNNLCESSSTVQNLHCARSLNFSNYCVECEKFLPTAEALGAHMESNHRLIDEATNYEIGGEFGWSSALNNQTNNENETRPFICTMCSLTFPLEESFQRHNFYVHGRASNRSSSKR